MSGAFSIGVAGPEDARSVTRLLGAAYPDAMAAAYPADVLAPALGFLIHANPSLLDSGTFYLARCGEDDVVGCGGWTREAPGTGTVKRGVAHLRHFATHPEWLRRGVGRALYERSESFARRAGVTRFDCLASLNAAAFYAALGFEAVDRVPVELAPGVALPSILMRRRL